MGKISRYVCLVKGKQAKMKGANNLKTSEIIGGFRGDSIAYRFAPRRGVFALKYFSRGDTVEICPVVTLARGDCHKKALYLSNRKGGAPMLLTGLGSLYSKGRANVTCAYTAGNVVFTASTNIKAGAELRRVANNCMTRYRKPLPTEPTAIAGGHLGGAVVVRGSHIHGRGVFALRSFRKGDIVETCLIHTLRDDVMTARAHLDCTITHMRVVEKTTAYYLLASVVYITAVKVQQPLI